MDFGKTEAVLRCGLYFFFLKNSRKFLCIEEEVDCITVSWFAAGNREGEGEKGVSEVKFF